MSPKIKYLENNDTEPSGSPNPLKTLCHYVVHYLLLGYRIPTYKERAEYFRQRTVIGTLRKIMSSIRHGGVADTFFLLSGLYIDRFSRFEDFLRDLEFSMRKQREQGELASGENDTLERRVDN